MSDKKEVKINCKVGLGLTSWLGGAFWVAHQPGCGFWDGVFWMWYVGRYLAAHFTLLSY